MVMTYREELVRAKAERQSPAPDTQKVLSRPRPVRWAVYSNYFGLGDPVAAITRLNRGQWLWRIGRYATESGAIQARAAHLRNHGWVRDGRLEAWVVPE